MGPGEDLLQVTNIDLEVLRRGLDVVVAEEFLDEADIDTPLEKVGRASVPQSVRMKIGDPHSETDIVDSGLE